MAILFDARHIYYLPQFLPVAEELSRRGVRCGFAAYDDPDVPGMLAGALERMGLQHHRVCSEDEALALYLDEKPDWIVFGNGFTGVHRLDSGTRTAMINHGAGVKAGGFNPAINRMSVRFLEGRFHQRALAKAFPESEYLVSGFAKLDPLIREHEPLMDLAAVGLDPGKPTVLYAPTFFPSSVDLMSDRFPLDFRDYNIIVKLHFFSYRKQRYASHLRKLERWRSAANVYVAGPEEFSILPFMDVADVMISDASTALFEFAALNKPVVWCDFLKLRWGYRWPFGYRLRRRMEPSMQKFRDIADHAASYRSLKRTVDAQLDCPRALESKRLDYSNALLGPLDGQASRRIANYMTGGSMVSRGDAEFQSGREYAGLWGANR